MPIISRLPISINNDEEHYVALVNCKEKMIKTKVLQNYVLFPQGLL